MLKPLFVRSRRAPIFPVRLSVLSLDRVLASPAGLIGGVEVHNNPLARRASDHVPLKARVDFAARSLPGRG
jgi:endonuclease/exonuclease/phosphatase family metal-dependent hydrolase